MASLVAGSVLCGALLQKYVTTLPFFQRTHTAASNPTRLAGPVTLRGPGGVVTLPMKTPALVHVWLEGCADCMPAFEAMKEYSPEDPGIPVVNIAFGSSREEWAREYGVAQTLVFDPSGEGVVHPLRISSFTTLLMDEQGYIRLRDRPDRPGYKDRVSGAWKALTSGPRPAAP